MNYKTLNVFKNFRKKKKEIIKEIQINDTVCINQFSTYTHYDVMATMMNLNNWTEGDSLYEEAERKDFVNEFTVVDIQPHIEAPNITLCGIRNNQTKKEYIVNLTNLVKIFAKQEAYKFQTGQKVKLNSSNTYDCYETMATMMNLVNWTRGESLSLGEQKNEFTVVAMNKHRISKMNLCGIKNNETNKEYIVDEINLEAIL